MLWSECWINVPRLVLGGFKAPAGLRADSQEFQGIV